jgi:hypothetical protein
MNRSLAFAAAALVAALVPAPAAAQTAPAKPLRTLVYTVQFSARTTNEEQSSGLRPGAASAYGTATTQRVGNVDDSGTLTAAVVAATADGALVIDASYAGKTESQPPIRVAVFGDGRLSYAPEPPLSPEAARLLPLLARGVVADRDVSPGSWWTVPAAAPARGASTYRVTSAEGDVATFAIDVDVTVPGPRGYEEHGKATARYDTRKLCPTAFDYTATSRHQPSLNQYVTTSAHLVATLVSDTFAPR